MYFCTWMKSSTISSENPTMRYLAGKDVEKLMEAKTGMSDEEFHKMMKQNMMK